MSRYALDPGAVGALGAALDDLAATLDIAGDVGADGWAFGPSATAGALAAVLGDWRHERLALARELHGLATGVRAAQALYADTEEAVAGRLLTGGLR